MSNMSDADETTKQQADKIMLTNLLALASRQKNNVRRFLNTLSDDELYEICCMLDLKSLGRFGCVNIVFLCATRRSSIYFERLLKKFPNYLPFSTSRDIVDTARGRLRGFICKKTHQEIIGTSKKVSKRYLHRSVTTPQGNTYFFGGDGNSAGPNKTYYNDIWQVLVSEKNTEKPNNPPTVCLRAVWFDESLPHPLPTSACALAPSTLPGSKEEEFFMYGGMINADPPNYVVSQFWKFKFFKSEDAHAIRRGYWTLITDIVPASRPSSSAVYGRNEFPSERVGHSLVSFAGYLVLFGGSAPLDIVYDDLWVYGEIAQVWEKMTPKPGTNSPQARGGHASVVCEGRYMFLYGGNDKRCTYSDVWCTDLQDIVSAYKARLEERRRAKIALARLDHNPALSFFPSLNLRLRPQGQGRGGYEGGGGLWADNDNEGEVDSSDSDSEGDEGGGG